MIEQQTTDGHAGEPIRLMPADRRLARHDMARLTMREIEVLVLAARGMANNEIAPTLSLSEPTIKTHLVKAMQKTGARNRTHLVALAYAGGLMHTPDADRLAEKVETVQRLRAVLCEIAALCGRAEGWSTALPLPQLVEHVLAVVRDSRPPQPTAAPVLDGAEADKAARLFEACADALAVIGAPVRVRRAVLGSVLDSTGIPPAIVGAYADDPAVVDALAERGVVLDGHGGNSHGT